MFNSDKKNTLMFYDFGVRIIEIILGVARIYKLMRSENFKMI